MCLFFRCHPFVITREDGEKSHGVAIVFYEEVKDDKICHAVHTLQKMYSTEAAAGGTSLKAAGQDGEGGGTLTRRSAGLRPRSAKGASSERSRSLPRHYQQVCDGM